MQPTRWMYVSEEGLGSRYVLFLQFVEPGVLTTSPTLDVSGGGGGGGKVGGLVGNGVEGQERLRGSHAPGLLYINPRIHKGCFGRLYDSQVHKRE